MSEEVKVPDGYKMDHRGCLVPVEIIREVDKLRDEVVERIVRDAVSLSESLREFKARAMDDVLAFVQLSAEQYGTKLGGAKGNISLTSFDGRYKVTRSINEYIAFDERLEAAKALLDKCLTSWTSGASEELRKLISFAFEVDKAGKISTARIMGLLRVDIHSEMWKSAMDAIRDSFQINGSREYIRIYKRVGGTDRYAQINLDIAAL